MADQDMLHTVEIMKAVLPFINSANKGMIDFFMKIFDLMASLKTFKTSPKPAATSNETVKFDMEGMLKAIRPVLKDDERESIDKITNLFSMMRAFEMYNKMQEAMNTMKDFSGFPFGESSTGDSTGEAETVAENFTGTNYDSIFHNSDDSSPSEETSSNRLFGYDHPIAETSDSDGNSSDSEKKKEEPSNTGFKMNDKMLEMLKAMVPPEQQSTFENLSMLLNTMSYDNNSKPDHSEVQNNG